MWTQRYRYVDYVTFCRVIRALCELRYVMPRYVIRALWVTLRSVTLYVIPLRYVTWTTLRSVALFVRYGLRYVLLRYAFCYVIRDLARERDGHLVVWGYVTFFPVLIERYVLLRISTVKCVIYVRKIKQRKCLYLRLFSQTYIFLFYFKHVNSRPLKLRDSVNRASPYVLKLTSMPMSVAHVS